MKKYIYTVVIVCIGYLLGQSIYTEITKDKFLKFFRSFFYQNFLPHLFLMYYKYFIVLLKNIFNKYKDSVELEMSKSEYISQIDSLKRVRTDFSKIVKSVKNINN